MNEAAMCMLMFVENKVRYSSCAMNGSNFRAVKHFKNVGNAKSHNVCIQGGGPRPLTCIGVIKRDFLYYIHAMKWI